MDIRQMTYFLAVVDAGSFTAASEYLYISQSSLSKRILALEEELGVTLFDRSRRKVTLTDAGETILSHARGLTKDYALMLEALAQYRSAAPPLAIGAIPVIAQYGITSFVAHFRKLYPQISFAVEERLASAILPGLDSHQYDLAFIRDSYVDMDRYTCTQISSDRLVAVVSDQKPYARRKAISLAELTDEPFILYDRGTNIHRLSIDACRSAGFEPKVSYTSVRVDNIISLVTSNMGVALLMEKVFEYHPHAGVVAIPIREALESNIVMVRLKDARLTESARSFIDMVIGMLKE